MTSAVVLAAVSLIVFLAAPSLALAGEPPVAAYSFDAGEGEIAEDAAGEHDGTIEGAGWTKGKFGGALDFDGEAGDLVTVPGTEDLQLEEFTVEAWVRPARSDLLAPVVAKLDDEDFGYALYAGGDEHAGRPEGYILDGKAIDSHAVDDETLPLHAWSHIAVTNDGAHLRLYVNGELVDTGWVSSVEAGGEGPLTIGGNEAFEEGEYFSGKIDEVRVYDRALDAGEIANDRSSGIDSPAAAPVAAYSFDEGEGSTVADAFGEHDGTVEGAEWAKGRFGRALHFDGTDDLVTVADSPDLDLTEEFTLEAWVRPDAAETWAPVIAKESPGSYGYQLFAGGVSAGVPEGEVAGAPYAWENVVAEEAIAEKAWSHIAMTYDGARLRLYVDGELIDTKWTSAPKAGEGDLRFGYIEGEEWFKGRIDEVRIYDRALDGGEIVGDKGAPVQTPPASPVAAYSFDEGEGSTVADAFGEHDGTVEGAGWTKGKFGQALEFDGEVGDFVTVPGTEDLQLEEFTVEAWVRPSQSDLLAPVVAKLDDEDFGYALYAGGDGAAGHPEGYLLEGSSIDSHAVDDEALPEHAWSHIAVTNDGAHMRLYVNGELADTGPTNQDVKAGGEGPLTIGGNEAFEEGEYFSGKIDEVRVYDRALDAGEIANDKSSGIDSPAAAPVAAYSFDAGAGEVAEDVSGENDGAIEGAEWFEHGRFGSALYFDGSPGDLVTVPDSNALDLSDEFTLEAWVRPDEANEWSAVITKERGGALSYQMHAEGEGNAPAGYVQNSEGNFEVEAGNEPIPPHVWSHLAMTYDGEKLRYYVNGEFKGSDSSGDPGVSGDPLFIGGDSWGEEDAFKGLIDEVRIYSRALGENEIATDLSVGIQSPSRAPVAAYSFDAGEGSTAEDVTGNEHDGEIEGASWFDNGKYGGALSFDGEDDIVTVPDSAALRLEEFTLEAWVRPEDCGLLEPVVAKLDDEELGYALYAGGDSNAGRPEGYILEGKEIDSHAVAEDSLSRHVWSHIAVTRDGARLRLYVNGELVDTGWASAGMAGGEGPLQIGGNESFVNPEYFEGLIDEVRIYNRALGREEIAESMGPLPVASTSEAYGVHATEAVFSGSLDPRNSEAAYFFEYGTTPAYGDAVPAVSENVMVGDEAREVEEAVDSLQPETTYYYRLVAAGAAGTVVGRSETLITGTASNTPEQLEADRLSLLTETNWRGFVNVQWSGDTPKTAKPQTMNIIEGSGAKMLRIGINGVSEENNELFKLAAERGITLLPDVSAIPGRLDQLIPPDNPETHTRPAWREKIRKLVEAYGHNGSFWKNHKALAKFAPDYWEIWNEPNFGTNGSTSRVRANGSGKILPARYGDLLEESNNVIDEVDSEAKILFGGLLSVGKRKGEFDKMPVGEFIKKAGHVEAYDALSLHPYAFQVSKKKSKDRKPKDAGGRAPTSAADVKVVTETVKKTIQSARSALDLVEADGKPIWITELGWPVKTPITPDDGSHLPVSEEIQRDLLNSTFNMIKKRSGKTAESYDIAKVFFYNVEDLSNVPKWEHHAGLREDDGSGSDYGQPGPYRKAWFAFQSQADFEGEFP